jgi:hypothetical protein
LSSLITLEEEEEEENETDHVKGGNEAGIAGET